MEVWLRRLFWIVALAIGAGGTAFSGWVSMEYGLPKKDEILWYLWPAMTATLAIVAFRNVRSAWRETPASFAGILQWRLADLIAASFITGGLMAVLSSLQPNNVSTFAIPVSLILGASFAVGLLVGARMGLAAWRQCYLYAAGFSLRMLGIVDIGAIMLILSIEILSFVPRSLADPIATFMGLLNLKESPHSIRLLFLFGLPLALFVVGHVLCHVAARTRAGAVNPDPKP